MKVVETGPGVPNLVTRRSRRGAVSDFLRQLFLLRAGDVLAVRELQSERAARGEGLGPFTLRHLRLLAFAGRLCGWAGRVCASLPFADVGPLKIPDVMTDEQALFLGDILPTGLYGRGELHHPGR